MIIKKTCAKALELALLSRSFYVTETSEAVYFKSNFSFKQSCLVSLLSLGFFGVSGHRVRYSIVQTTGRNYVMISKRRPSRITDFYRIFEQPKYIFVLRETLK